MRNLSRRPGPPRPGRRAGTSLIEVLVVIVIFAVGILAVIQIFPGGLRVLTLTRNQAIAAALARDELERVTGRADQLPDRVVPVRYVYDSVQGDYFIVEDENRRVGDLGPVAGTLGSDGVLRDASNNIIGYWPLVSGGNIAKRVVGEGRQVPAPRQAGNFFGGLMVLQYGPIYYNENIERHLTVYGRDLVRLAGSPGPDDVPQPDQYFADGFDTNNPRLILPADSTRSRRYRLELSFYETVGSTTRKRTLLDEEFVVNPIPGGGFAQFSIATNAPLSPGATFAGAEFDSVRVARMFERVPPAANFMDPYEYKLLDSNLGLLLFSDLAAKTFERRAGRRVPIEARVSYDVLDWRIIRDEFRIPGGEVPRVKLAIGNIKVKGSADVDASTYEGLNILVPTGNNTTERRDVIFMDLDTGGIILERSVSRVENGEPKRLIRIDKSLGVVTFFDADGNPTNGLQGEVVFPGDGTPTDVNLTGRAVRALYQARGEWTVQLLKAPSTFGQSGGTPATSEFYIGGTDATVGGLPHRLYFPQSEAGRRVTIDELFYVADVGGTAVKRTLHGQSFVVQSQPADPIGLPYVDIKSLDPDALWFDFETYGYAVRGVKGASLTIRVLWNPSTLYLDRDPNRNLDLLDQWGRDWRQTIVESYVGRPVE